MKEANLKVIFVTADAGSPFGLPIRKGAADAAAALGMDCLFTGPAAFNVREQAAIARAAIDSGCDGLALNIIDASALDPVIDHAHAKGVAVMAFNVNGSAARPARVVGVTQKFKPAGRKAGEAFKPHVPQGSRVLITMHDPGVSALEERADGVKDALTGHVSGFTVIASGARVEQSADSIARALDADPSIGAILATGQADTEAAGRVLASRPAAARPAAAGFDLSPGILDAIETGLIAFTIDQQPYLQGYLPVVQLALYKRYGIAPVDVDAGANLIGKAEAPQVRILTKDYYR